MDFVNSAIAQISDLFRSMTPGARITAGLLLAVVIISVGYLFQQSGSGPDAYLFGGQALSDSELTLIEAAVSLEGLAGHSREGNRLRVPAGKQAAYMAAIAGGNALPRNFNTILENAINEGGPWESAEAKRERLKIAKQQMLSEIVRAMTWVQEAVVLYDEQRERGMLRPKEVVATVSVRPVLGESLHPGRVKTLQTLLAKSVLGLDPNNVAVTDLNDGTSFGAGGEIYSGIFDDEFYQLKVAFEMQKRNSILNALRHFPGVNVEVNAELDDTVEEFTQNVKPDPKPATLKEISSTESSRQTTTDGGGRPGASAQGPGRGGQVAAPTRQNQNVRDSDTTETINFVGQEQHTVRRKGFTPKEIWATVTIPSTHAENLWRQRNPQASERPKPEDLSIIKGDLVTDIETIVEPLLIQGALKAEDTYKHVKVVVVDTLPAPALEPPAMTAQALAWTSRYGSTLAMVGVAVFSLLVLRSLAKSGPPSGTTPSVPTLQLDASEAPTPEDAEEGERPRLRLKKGSELKDDLIEIVREDPDAAADILRGWIGKAA